MKNKICLITGATSGIGAATALALAQKGATTILIGRDREKCERTVKKIRNATGNSSVDYILADFSSLEDIRKLYHEFKSRYDKLDILINNAGARFVTRQETIDSYEMTFSLNHLAAFLLTNLLLDFLKVSEKSRIINVASSAHATCNAINFEDLQSEKHYNGKYAYAQSKLANILFTYELARRLTGTGLTVNTLHPGIVWTKFMKNNGFINWLRHIIYYLLHGKIVGVKRGAKTSVYLASSPEVDGVTGKYFSDCRPIRSSEASYDEETARRLWDVSMELTGLSKRL